MSITYKDIRQKKEELKKKREERIQTTQKAALKLVNEYKKSLSLENDSWKDIKNIDHPYVYVVINYNEDKYRAAKISEIELTYNYTLEFVIMTVIDDSARGGESIATNISVWVDDSGISVYVGQSGGRLVVIDDNWVEVCDSIKDDVYQKITDPYL